MFQSGVFDATPIDTADKDPLATPGRRRRTRVAGIIVSITLGVSAVAGVGNWYSGRLMVEAARKCINELRVFDGAKQEWALELHKSKGASPTWEDIRPFMGCQSSIDGLMPPCPSGGTYTLGRVADPPKCSCPSHDIDANP